mgnify:CR=1 FL=1
METQISQSSDIIPIETRILTLRNQQVLLDRDLAELYGVETKVLNQAVKRNIERFPTDFRFQLTKEECLRSQIVTLNTARGQHLKYLPYAFTEQGVAMLSSVLKSDIAITVSVNIMKAFVAMRHLQMKNAHLFQRMEMIELKQMQTDEKVDKILNQLSDHTALPPKQGVFFEGQIFDAYQFVADLVRSAKSTIVLIDNYVNDSVLTLLDKRAANVTATIGVNKITPGLQLDLQRHNAQYPPIVVRELAAIHDRFLLIDGQRLYTFGASFKDLGKKLFCFSLLESEELVRAVGAMLQGGAEL